MNIRNAVLPIVFISHSVFAAESVYPCDKNIYYGETFRGSKEVKVCLSKGKVSYTYGSVNKKEPELDILVSPEKAYWIKYNVNIWDTSKAPGDDYRTINSTIGITNGEYKYELSSGSISDSVFDQIVVSRNGKRLDKIRLRRETVSYHIDLYLEEYGIVREKGNFWGG